MKKQEKGKVFYVCFYAEAEVENKIIVYPSVISKIDYIVDAVKSARKEVVLVSVAPSSKGKFSGYKKTIDSHETHIYLPSRTSKNKFLKKLYFIKQSIEIFLFLRKNVKENDTVLVYHSLHHLLWIKLYNRFAKGKLILQIEDVFSSLTEKAKRQKKQEWKLFNRMQKCLCVNDILYEDLKNVPSKLVSYGNYNLPPQYKKQEDGKIRAVYAGVIEQERKAAFKAVQAAEYLPTNYEIHILGFGTQENISSLKEKIDEINQLMGRSAAFFQGKKTGEEYWRFLQNCDVALSTHTYSKDTLESADYTFPSKVITYMANNLPVVAQRLSVLEKSAIAENMVFYDHAEPREIASAIITAFGKKHTSSRNTIQNLDHEFKKAIKSFLEE